MAYFRFVPPYETIDILGLEYARLTAEQALSEAERLYEQEAPAWIAVENVHGVNLACADDEHQKLLNRADLLLNDGKGVMLAARLKGSRFREDLNGNHFGFLLLRRAARRGWPVFFLGAGPGVAARAAEKLMDDIPGLKVTGVRDGYFKPEDLPEIKDQIAASGGGLLLVGMGNPLQERWLDEHMASTGARLGLTVGAFFDFQAGELPRAPRWMNKLGLEWVHRLMTEPKRMWRRYLIGNPLFIWRVLRARYGERSVARGPR
ncbi:MAG: WecB/TagA/CpsF family glycosyltransferase [Actinomycetota bacterium]|nr:WecB/TagA/CpsF family glycosyltransferase [Actinomycetota bacterium]